MKLPVKMFANPFVGDPSPELDHAWHELFEDVNIRVTAEDLEYAELKSLELADGSGDYIGQLGVHHELHCLVSAVSLCALSFFTFVVSRENRGESTENRKR